jgi:hypothetical protein
MLRDKKMVLLGMLSIGLVSTWAYHLYEKMQYPDIGAGKKNSNTANVQDSLQQVYGTVISELDHRLVRTQTDADSMRSELSFRLHEIETLKAEINAVLQNGSSSERDLRSAQEKIGQLQILIRDLEKEKTSLEEEKKQLASTMTQLSLRVEQLVQDIRNLGDENLALSSKVNEASVFVASQVNLQALSIRNDKEQETTRLKKTNKFIVSFAVQNHMHDYNNTDVHIVILQPDGRTLKNNDIWETTTTTTASGSAMSYTAKLRFDYNKGELKTLHFSVTPEEFQPGTYTMKLYHKGVSIGESRLLLN